MRRPNRIFILYVIFLLLYIGLNLITPTEAHVLTRYGLTQAQAQILKIGVFIPYVLIWFTAFWGASRFKKYALSIHKSKDGKALSAIGDGLIIIAVGLPLNSLLSSLVSVARIHAQDLVPVATIFRLYVDIAVGVLAFTLISKGASSLLQIVKTKTTSVYEFIFMGLFLVLGTTYTYLTLQSPYRQFPNPDNGQAIFYLPDFLLVLTIIVPYLYTWYMGLSSAFAVQVYRQNVKGVLYRKMLGYVASGLLFVITARIVLRFMASMSAILSASSLKFVLILIYMLLILIATGFVLIAIGTRRLNKIEEV